MRAGRKHQRDAAAGAHRKERARDAGTTREDARAGVSYRRRNGWGWGRAPESRAARIRAGGSRGCARHHGRGLGVVAQRVGRHGRGQSSASSRLGAVAPWLGARHGKGLGARQGRTGLHRARARAGERCAGEQGQRRGNLRRGRPSERELGWAQLPWEMAAMAGSLGERESASSREEKAAELPNWSTREMRAERGAAPGTSKQGRRGTGALGTER